MVVLTSGAIVLNVFNSQCITKEDLRCSQMQRGKRNINWNTCMLLADRAGCSDPGRPTSISQLQGSSKKHTVVQTSFHAAMKTQRWVMLQVTGRSLIS